jgi:hypothetical protein
MNTRAKKKTRIYRGSDSTRIPFTPEEVYDIFRQIFHNHDDAMAATLQLFGGDEDIIDDSTYGMGI